MLPSYTFNEQLKRFEPAAKECGYCSSKSDQASTRTAYYIPLFKENDRTNIVVYRSVKYQKIVVGVPRCDGCQKIHSKAKRDANLYSWLGALCLFAASFYLFDLFGIVIAFLVALFAGAIGAGFLENLLMMKSGVKTPRNGAKFNTLVQEFIISGWSFNQPTA